MLFRSFLINREAGQNVRYRIISDHLGSVRLVVNADTGVVAQRLRYDEFGVVLEDTNPGFQPFGYAGGFYDADTGLVRFGARDYDAGSGRWLAKDAAVFENMEWNQYTYCDSDSINFFDADGESKVSGQSNIGGNDPLAPRNMKNLSPKEQAQLAENLRRTLKDASVGQVRKRFLKGVLKVLLRKGTKSFMPPLIEDLTVGAWAEACKAGDGAACLLVREYGDPCDYGIRFVDPNA